MALNNWSLWIFEAPRVPLHCSTFIKFNYTLNYHILIHNCQRTLTVDLRYQKIYRLILCTQKYQFSIHFRVQCKSFSITGIIEAIRPSASRMHSKAKCRLANWIVLILFISHQGATCERRFVSHAFKRPREQIDQTPRENKCPRRRCTSVRGMSICLNSFSDANKLSKQGIAIGKQIRLKNSTSLKETHLRSSIMQNADCVPERH